jgi:branched-chain amino acid aminotransferase
VEFKKEILPPEKRKPLPADPTQLEFGTTFTDHMFTMEYTPTHGWSNGRIKPYQPLILDPATMMFHYSQAVFEGQKAYLSPKEEILLFRPQENARRLRRSMQRMEMPEISEETFLQAECELLKVEKRWIPREKGTSLYIRPVVIPTEPLLGSIRASKTYLFYIILAPAGFLFKGGMKPIGLLAEKNYTRAATGGTGEAKTPGNYAGTILVSRMAAEKGCSQVLWLDAKEHKYVEEVGTNNIFFVIDGKLLTPPLTGTILPGVTRKSVLEMANDQGIGAEERVLSIEEVIQAIDSGRMTESFGAGTAAVINPVGQIHYNGRDYVINNNKIGPWTKRFYDTLIGVQCGLLEDKFGWVYRVD